MPCRWTPCSEIVPQLIEHGKVERVGIGIRKPGAGLDSGVTGPTRGCSFQYVVPGGRPRSGVSNIADSTHPEPGVIKVTALGDLIVAANHEPVANSADLYRVLDRLKAGDEVVITVLRDGVENDISVTLQVIE